MTTQPRLYQRKGCWLGTACIFIVVVVLLILAITLAMLEPERFSPPAEDSEEVSRRARVFEKNFVSQLTRVREDEEPWGVRIDEEDLNAWLWIRFPRWMAHLQGAGSFGTESMFQTSIEPERVIILSNAGLLAFEPVLEEEGSVGLYAAEGSSIGRLPVPRFMFERVLGMLEYEQLGEVLTASLGDPSSNASTRLTLPSQFPLGDGRAVELLEIQLSEGDAVLIFRTEPMQP